MFNLAIPFPDISPILYEIPKFTIFGHGIGPLALRWYALGYIIGIIIAWNILIKLSKSPKLWANDKPPFNSENIDDFIFYATLGILFGGRLGYVFFYQRQMLLDPLSILRTWEGGMSFHGGLIGVLISIIGVSIFKKISLLNLADAVALAAPIGIGLVRVTNFINQELYGRPTDVPWAFIFDTDPLQIPRHPSQLYEAMFEGFLPFLIISIMVFKFKSLKNKGLTAGLFAILYSIARISLENLRQPDIGLDNLPYGLTMGIILSTPLLLLGIGLIFYSLKNKSKIAQ